MSVPPGARMLKAFSKMRAWMLCRPSMSRGDLRCGTSG